MSLQRRLLLYLLVCAPLVWAVALYVSVGQARLEVNELFDAQLIRLARQVQSTLGTGLGRAAPQLPSAPAAEDDGVAHGDERDLAIAVWDRRGRLVVFDREGVAIPYQPGRSGFVNEQILGSAWRVYYLQSFDGEWLVAAGQRVYERDELVYGLTLSQVLPWLFVLPVLLAVMAWAVRHALSPLKALTREVLQRPADDLRPLSATQAPAELQPLLAAMNGLFVRIGHLLVRERRFTADAAHELRTPLAVLRAQWDVVRRAANPQERAEAEAKLGKGLDRMGRLVHQMLVLSRVESGVLPVFADVQWVPVVEQAVSDCLALAEQRGIELACEWPPTGQHPLPLLGDEHLLTVLLRNLLDNAVRYAPMGTAVTLRILPDGITLENQGHPLPDGLLARIGERFHRPEGQQEAGSGLGVSIVRRIADLHGLVLRYGTLADGSGVKVGLHFPGGGNG